METARATGAADAAGDYLDRLLALLQAARAEEAARRRTDLRANFRALLAAIEGAPAAERAA